MPPSEKAPGDRQGPVTPVWNIARQALSGLGGSDSDPAPLIPDSSVADPASVGVALLLANWTNLDSNDDQYKRAARNPYNYLLSDSAPKTGQGNAWAAAGMLRVYATIDNSDFSGGKKNQKKDLKNRCRRFTNDIFENLLRNYLNDRNTFYDTAATALLAATAYHASTVMDIRTYVRYAECSRLI
ncbi:hypothetical protein MD484_g8927, partial [Candolleomyces efflorescens]